MTDEATFHEGQRVVVRGTSSDYAGVRGTVAWCPASAPWTSTDGTRTVRHDMVLVELDDYVAGERAMAPEELRAMSGQEVAEHDRDLAETGTTRSLAGHEHEVGLKHELARVSHDMARATQPAQSQRAREDEEWEATERRRNAIDPTRRRLSDADLPDHALVDDWADMEAIGLRPVILDDGTPILVPGERGEVTPVQIGWMARALEREGLLDGDLGDLPDPDELEGWDSDAPRSFGTDAFIDLDTLANTAAAPVRRFSDDDEDLLGRTIALVTGDMSFDTTATREVTGPRASWETALANQAGDREVLGTIEQSIVAVGIAEGDSLRRRSALLHLLQGWTMALADGALAHPATDTVATLGGVLVTGVPRREDIAEGVLEGADEQLLHVARHVRSLHGHMDDDQLDRVVRARPWRLARARAGHKLDLDEVEAWFRTVRDYHEGLGV